MPVRIYDIAKKLGIENKEVLTKAKELGITAARVPSSSLDKITAEYLESHLKPAKPAVPETPPPPPQAPEPIVIVSAPPAEAPSPVAEAVPALFPVGVTTPQSLAAAASPVIEGIEAKTPPAPPEPTPPSPPSGPRIG